MKARVCELCAREATLYCASDSAFLCSDCDARVHGANFLVARHIRQAVCSKCQGLSDNHVTGSGVAFRHLRRLCRACSDEADVSDSSTTSSDEFSACISSTESFVCTSKRIGGGGFDLRRGKVERIASSSSVTDASGVDSIDSPSRFSGEVTSAVIENNNNKKKKCEIGVETRGQRTTSSVEAKAEGIFVNWSARMGLYGNSRVVALALQTLCFCLGRGRGERGRVLPSKVMLAASFWLGLKFCGGRSMSTCQNLRRLEEASGVPAKLILTVGVKIARDLRARNGRRDLEEGWAECSV